MEPGAGYIGVMTKATTTNGLSAAGGPTAKGLRVCVFCGAAHGSRPDYPAAAFELGAAIAKRGMTLIYGGGRAGLMGAVADAAIASGGEVIGVITLGDLVRLAGPSHPGLIENLEERIHARGALTH